jgi:hypothetical protein
MTLSIKKDKGKINNEPSIFNSEKAQIIYENNNKKEAVVNTSKQLQTLKVYPRKSFDILLYIDNCEQSHQG